MTRPEEDPTPDDPAEPTEDGPTPPPAGDPTPDPDDAAQDDSRPPEAPGDGPDDPPGDEGEGDDAPTGNREAQKYRTRLREAEAERDALRAQVAEFHAEKIAGMAEEYGLADGRDLMHTATVEQLLGDDGRPDPEKIKAATEQTLDDRPHWSRRGAPSQRPTERLTMPPPGGSDPNRDPSGTSWADVLRGATR